MYMYIPARLKAEKKKEENKASGEERESMYYPYTNLALPRDPKFA